jgi:hypothetical protein
MSIRNIAIIAHVEPPCGRERCELCELRREPAGEILSERSESKDP